MGNGTRDLPACSIVPQSTTLPRALDLTVELNISNCFIPLRFSCKS
jgi:hypothetical protein